MERKEYTADFGDKEISLTASHVAERADSAVVVRLGGTAVLVTVVVADEPREGVDFFPLIVDYEERLYAAGKISGSRFIKREGRPTDNAVLNARLIDRTIRPLFPKGYRNDVQVIATVLAMDGEQDPDMLAMFGASTALMMSSAPFQGPIVGFRVGEKEGQFIFNPTMPEQAQSPLDLVVGAKEERIMMLEAGADQVPETRILEAIAAAHQAMQPLFALQAQIKKDYHKEESASVDVTLEGTDIHVELKSHLGERLAQAVRELDRAKREQMVKEYETEALSTFEGNYKQMDIKGAFTQLLEKEFRQVILADGVRPDGRQLDEIRPLSSEPHFLPRTHGSALFTRGDTQVLSIATLAGPGAEQLIDTMELEGEKRFMHHYNFPPYSVGEVRPMRGAGRREIGHGALAERAVEPIIPDREGFPYTIRVVSEVLSSNGSSSMAATCGTILALMDAGVPIKEPVAGIAIGLVTEEGFNEDSSVRYQLLTDIQGIEDFGGDMDFKVTGTKNGVTAIQLDMKVKGLTLLIIQEALARAQTARLKVLEHMLSVLPAPRSELSEYAPRILTVKIPQDKIGDLIGPGGKNINKIIELSGGKVITQIDIEEDGTVMVTSTNAEFGRKAVELIEAQVVEAEVGKTYTGTVTSIQKNRMSGQEIGALVEILPGKVGMVHISEVANERIPDVSSRLKVGDKVRVKVLELDSERGRIGLSIKQAE
ncbi:polyribonucleotide nucleotidyltransferase [Candidatus Berkelbacteria bacterium]|nr:polyribonucleotide nucleotidyltransferase [Candidatus Berkelbacteria bacterium]